MSESKQKAKAASQARRIESNQQERASLALFLDGASPENRHDRQLYDGLFDDFQLDDARAELFEVVKVQGDQPISQICSADMLEYETTQQVIDYLLKVTDTKIRGPWSRAILKLEKRAQALDAGTYQAPSVKAAANGSPAPAEYEAPVPTY